MSLIPLHLCVAIKRRCFKYNWFWVGSIVFMNNFYVLFILYYVKTLICSITFCTPFKQPFQKYLCTTSSILCVSFINLSTAPFYSVSWLIQGFYVIKLLCLGKEIEENLCFVISLDTCFCRHCLVHGSLILCEASCTRQE